MTAASRLFAIAAFVCFAACPRRASWRSVGPGLLALAALACGSKPAPSGAPDAGAVADGAAAPAAERVIVELPAHVDQCLLGHEGILIDLGAPAARALYGIKEEAALEATQHDGATWDRTSSHTLTLRFAGTTLPEPLGHLDGAVQEKGETWVDVRLRGLAARRLSVSLNGKGVGTAALTKGEVVIRSLHANASLLTDGTNELVLRFGGAGRAPDAVAEIDWIRVGTQPAPTYVAPTYDGAVATETLAGVARRAVALGPPAFIRCTAALPAHAVFDVSLGLLGKGSGEVDVRWLRDRLPALTLGSAHVDDASGWTTLSLPMPDDAQGVGALEVRIDRGTKAARVLVADATLHAPAHPHVAAPTARGAVLLVLGQMPALPSTPSLSMLAKRSRTFEASRATSTWAAASLGSMLTGRQPTEHGAESDGSRLATDVMTIADAARDAGIVTAMFTANPTTSAAFGFARGFETFKSFFPSDGSATRVMEEAASWIAAHKAERFLVVVHARGGHPPWDVPAEALKTLPPEGYVGAIEPGLHAAEILAHARHVPPLVRFNDADRKRAWALHDYAVTAHDAALGRLLAALDEAGRGDDTAVIVAGDVGVDTAAHVPFGDAEPLDESALTTLLLVRSAGQTTSIPVHSPVSSIDVGTTVLAALGLAAPATFEGEDLAQSDQDDGTRPVFSSLGERSLVSWMGLLLRQGPVQSELCVPSMDAACASDVSALEPLASEALRKLLSDVGTRKRAAHEPPTMDPKTAAALTLWGR